MQRFIDSKQKDNVEKKLMGHASWLRRTWPCRDPTFRSPQRYFQPATVKIGVTASGNYVQLLRVKLLDREVHGHSRCGTASIAKERMAIDK